MKKSEILKRQLKSFALLPFLLFSSCSSKKMNTGESLDSVSVESYTNETTQNNDVKDSINYQDEIGNVQFDGNIDEHHEWISIDESIESDDMFKVDFDLLLTERICIDYNIQENDDYINIINDLKEYYKDSDIYMFCSLYTLPFYLGKKNADIYTLSKEESPLSHTYIEYNNYETFNTFYVNENIYDNDSFKKIYKSSYYKFDKYGKTISKRVSDEYEFSTGLKYEQVNINDNIERTITYGADYAPFEISLYFDDGYILKIDSTCGPVYVLIDEEEYCELCSDMVNTLYTAKALEFIQKNKDVLLNYIQNAHYVYSDDALCHAKFLIESYGEKEKTLVLG